MSGTVAVEDFLFFRASVFSLVVALVFLCWVGEKRKEMSQSASNKNRELKYKFHIVRILTFILNNDLRSVVAFSLTYEQGAIFPFPANLRNPK